MLTEDCIQEGRVQQTILAMQAYRLKLRARQVGTGGSITNSMIYCYTGNGDTVDKTVVYDENGEIVE